MGILFGKSEKERRQLIVINLARFLFICLIIFEILNFLKIIQMNTQFTWLGLVITSIVTLVILEFTAIAYKQKKGYYMHWSIWVIICYALSMDAAGDFLHLYGKYDWWDQAVHYSNSAVVCFALFAVINAFWIDRFQYALLFKEGRLKLAVFLATASTVSLGALYEIEEYIEDVLFHTNRLGPGTDTANDLVMNTSGALTTALIIVIYYLVTKKRKIIE